MEILPSGLFLLLVSIVCGDINDFKECSESHSLRDGDVIPKSASVSYDCSGSNCEEGRVVILMLKLKCIENYEGKDVEITAKTSTLPFAVFTLIGRKCSKDNEKTKITEFEGHISSAGQKGKSMEVNIFVKVPNGKGRRKTVKESCFIVTVPVFRVNSANDRDRPV